MRYLIIGTGRSGTGYMAKLLTACGIPCGHEAYFKPERRPSKDEWRRVYAESSWLAIAHPWSFKGRKLIHALRDPLKVWESLMRIGFFSGEGGHPPYEKVARELAGISADDSRAAQCAAWMDWVYTYISKIDQPVTTVKVDRLTRGQLRNLLNIDKGTALRAMAEVPTNVNSRVGQEFEADVPYEVRQWRDHYGYEED